MITNRLDTHLIRWTQRNRSEHVHKTCTSRSRRGLVRCLLLLPLLP